MALTDDQRKIIDVNAAMSQLVGYRPSQLRGTHTGQRLVLFVGLALSRWGRHFRRPTENGDTLGALSNREREVLNLVALGATSPEIASQLHISHNTVRKHVNSAMRKLGARSRAHLVAKALGEGHIER
jgi:DNA-binding CsgD family transcriptional regulator